MIPWKTATSAFGKLCLTSSNQRFIHTSPATCSVFMKRQKKIDPEIAKTREIRKRKKLEKEIREMMRHSKKPKPVDEMALDVKSAKNLSERIRPPTQLSDEVVDERALVLKEYCRSRSHLMKADEKWIRTSIFLQNKALAELKKLDPKLYEAAIQPDTGSFPQTINGPSLSAPVENYDSPDGEYTDTTRTWS
ncbi:unnamed protein product, partial [Mesorhabditis spiculigera]